MEALRLLARPGYRPLAGGTATVGPVDAETAGLVDLSDLPLRFSRMEPAGLTLGAMTTLAEVLDLPELLLAGGGVLGQAIERTGPPTLLTRATLGGCLARPDLAPELTTALLALDAQVLTIDPEMRRATAQPGARVGQGCLIEGVRIPLRPVLTGYERVARTPRDLPTVAVVVALEPDGAVARHVRIAACGVADRPIRLTEVERAIEGTNPAGVEIEVEVTPPSDLRGSSEYRRHLAAVLTRRALATATERLGRM